MPGASNFQRAWASIPGRIAQGALVDPALGTVQTGAHLVSGFNRLAGHPEWGDPAASVDTVVNSVNNSLDAARVADGQRVGGHDGWRDLGGILSPYNFVVPEVEGAVLAERAGVGAKAAYETAKDAVNAAISAPVDTRHDSFWSGKAEETGKAAAIGAGKSFLGAGAGAVRDRLGGAGRAEVTSVSKPSSDTNPMVSPIGNEVPGRAGIDTPSPPPGPMSDLRPGDFALAALERTSGPMTSTGPSMPWALFGGDYQARYPDYPVGG